MKITKIGLHTKTIENNTLLKIWKDNLEKCTDREIISDQILDDMESFPLKDKDIFKNVHHETKTYFIKNLIDRGVGKMNIDENLELSDFGYMFVFNTVYDKLQCRFEDETNGWIEAVRTEMEMIKNGDYLR